MPGRAVEQQHAVASKQQREDQRPFFKPIAAPLPDDEEHDDGGAAEHVDRVPHVAIVTQTSSAAGSDGSWPTEHEFVGPSTTTKERIGSNPRCVSADRSAA